MPFLLISLIISLFIATWVASDARRRGYSTSAVIGWFIGVFFLLIVFLPLYLILRPRQSSYLGEDETAKICPHCGKLFKDNPNFCPYCGERLR